VELNEGGKWETLRPRGEIPPSGPWGGALKKGWTRGSEQKNSKKTKSESCVFYPNCRINKPPGKMGGGQGKKNRPRGTFWPLLGDLKKKSKLKIWRREKKTDFGPLQTKRSGRQRKTG